MAVTLNGIAQGYVTDRVAELLRAGQPGCRFIGFDVVGEHEPSALGRVLEHGLRDHDRSKRSPVSKSSGGDSPPPGCGAVQFRDRLAT
jgi:hypothetical protein